jgi:hypothetical protein
MCRKTGGQDTGSIGRNGAIARSDASALHWVSQCHQLVIDWAMVAFVLGFNIVLSVLLWVVAWQVWTWRRRLAQAAYSLTVAERATHRVLANAPEWVLQGQAGSSMLHERYHDMQLQLRQARQALTVLSAGLALYRGTFWPKNRRAARKHGKH